MTNITTCREKRVISRRRGGKSNNITSNNDYKRIILCLEFFAHKHTSRISKLLQKNNNLISILKRDTKYSYKLKNYSICCWPTLKNLRRGTTKYLFNDRTIIIPFIIPSYLSLFIKIASMFSVLVCFLLETAVVSYFMEINVTQFI